MKRGLPLRTGSANPVRRARLGMGPIGARLMLVGLAATLAGGCPLRQLIQAGEGNLDAAACVLGMLAGAAVAHGLNTAGSPAGLAWNGQVAVAAGLVVTAAIGYLHCKEAV